MVLGTAPKKVLDLTKRNPEVEPMLSRMSHYIVGQQEPMDKLIETVELYLSNLRAPGRPIGSLLFLGPTGSGKTRVVEALAATLFGDQRAMIKIDCAEFQHSHEIAKLIGSPPGYLGHRETHPLLTQEALNQWFTEKLKMSILLFDEIEKASDSLWQLLLGVLDKATLTLGDNRRVDLSQCIIIMTSNLGAKQLQNAFADKLGFQPKVADIAALIDEERNSEATKASAKKHFTPEFMNRIDHVCTFHTLTVAEIRQIMGIELGMIQSTMFQKAGFLYQLTDAAKDKIMQEGYSVEYGARHLKRTIEKLVRLPLARLVSSGQIEKGSTVVIDHANPRNEDFEFSIQSLNTTTVKFTDTNNIL